MKQVQIIQSTHLEDVRVIDTPMLLTPSKDQVLIKVEAASINPIDWKMIEGIFNDIRYPFTPGSDFSGVIEQVGVAVQNFQVGDAVYGLAGVHRRGTGSFSEKTLADISFIDHKPNNLTFEEAAAIPMAGWRAWHSLHDLLKVERSQHVLIQGGAGGIGSYAIQIAKYLGAHVTSTANTKNQTYIKHLGADTVIDYTKQDITNLLNKYDAVFDTVGAGTFEQSLKVLKKEGKITSMPPVHTETAMKYGINPIEQMDSATRQTIRAITQLIDAEIIRVNIDKIFSFSEINNALDYQKNGHPRGKVVVKI